MVRSEVACGNSRRMSACSSSDGTSQLLVQLKREINKSTGDLPAQWMGLSIVRGRHFRDRAFLGASALVVCI